MITISMTYTYSSDMCVLKPRWVQAPRDYDEEQEYLLGSSHCPITNSHHTLFPELIDCYSDKANAPANIQAEM
jgi:hypothetical protein